MSVVVAAGTLRVSIQLFFLALSVDIFHLLFDQFINHIERLSDSNQQTLYLD